MIRIKKDIVIRIYAYIYICSMFLASKMIYGEVIPGYNTIAKTVLLFLGVFPLLFLSQRIRCISSGVLVLFIILMLFPMITILNGMPLNKTVFYIVVICENVAFIYLMKQNNIDVLFCLYRILILIIIICFILWMIYDLGWGKNSCIYFYNGINPCPYRYYSWFYYKWTIKSRCIMGVNIVSLYGLWREPGFFQIFSNFAVIYCMFIRDKEGKGYFFELIITNLASIMSTSTMGYIILLVIWVCYFASCSRDILKKILAIMISAIAAMIVGYNIVIEKMSTGSWGQRTFNFSNSIDILKNAGLFGTGYESDIWAGLFSYIINYGVIGFIPIALFIYGCKRDFLKIKNGWAYLSIYAWYFLSLINEPEGYNVFILFIYSLIICFLLNEKRGFENQNIKCDICHGVF